MRASPAIHVSASRFGLWRGAVGVLAMAVVGTILLWLVGRDPPAAAPTQAIVGVLLCAVIGLAIHLARVRHVGLRRDGQAWHLSDTGNSIAETPGEVTVAIDLGAWMLLRFKLLRIQGSRVRGGCPSSAKASKGRGTGSGVCSIRLARNPMPRGTGRE